MARLGRVLLLALALSLTTVSVATAAPRYAAPGGTGADPCDDPADPCSIYTAADNAAPGTTIEAGATVELAPGTYSQLAGDLGPSGYVVPPAAVSVRGEPGEARPVIVLQINSGTYGAFFLSSAVEVMDLEIRNQAANGSAITIDGGTMNRVIARNTVSSYFTCAIEEGEIGSSACLNDAGGVAMGVSTETFPGVHASTIRNSTAIATGPGSVGLDFAFFATGANTIGAVNALAVIAKGEAKDVIARGKEGSGSGKGATTLIELQASDYATTSTETSGPGTAIVAAPGTNGNITAVPLMAADNIHQLPTSPTIDKGAIDGASGPFDVDGQLREIGLAPDIGADELGNPTTTSVGCSTASISPSGQTTCTVTVVDRGTVLTQPSGEVALPAVSGLELPSSCALVPAQEDSATCSVSVVGAAVGVHTITAVYAGDDRHEGSQGSTSLSVAEPPSVNGGGGKAKGNDRPPSTQLKKHPPKTTAKRRAKFTFTSNERNARFECKLDKKPFRSCASPFKRKVKPGKHRFQVRAVDAQSQVDATPAIFSWKVIRPAS